jgi:3-oxoacyl-[acyl-carrier protein] reductase
MANAGGEVHALAADLGRDDECDRLFAWATSTLGGLDILVNNTVGPPTGGVLEVSDDQWRESFDLIFMSALRLSRAAIPVMREGGGGSIVNLASLTAKQPIDGIALSNALRPALVGMAKTLSREAAPEVRVNNIATEHILTDRIRDIAERIWRQGEESVDETLWRMALTVPLGRYGTPQELASAVVFLASGRGQLHHRGDARGRWRARSRALLTGNTEAATRFDSGVTKRIGLQRVLPPHRRRRAVLTAQWSERASVPPTSGTDCSLEREGVSSPD